MFLKELAGSYAKLEIRPTTRLLLACSAGADSTVLAHATAMLAKLPESNFSSDKIVLAHFNHKLRGEQSDADEEFVRMLATKLGCVFRSESASVRGQNEAQLRELRYRFLHRVALSESCSVIATSHHADDQAETVLHNVLRGTGLRGLAGIPVTRESGRIRYVRPLLQITRQQIRAFADRHNISFREDCSNTDEKYTRNFIRHTVLPQLHEQVNSCATQHLTELSYEAREWLTYLDDMAAVLLQRAVIEQQSNSCRFSTVELRKEPAVVLRHTFRFLWNAQKWPLQKMSVEHWHQLAAAVREESRFDLPAGLTVVSDHRLVRLFRRKNYAES